MAIIETSTLIIGAGPAGYTASIYAARANLNPIQVSGAQPGGQLMITTDVENYPGFSEAVQGPWLMDQMRNQALNVGTKIIEDTILSVDFSSFPFQCCGQSNQYTSKTVIIATGAQAKWLGLASEQYFTGYGVSGCATCDGFFFREKDVMVVGGGNTAVEEALFLTNFAKKVILVHRRDELRAEKIAQERLFNNPKISVIWNHEVDEILGEEKPFRQVTNVQLKNTITKEIQNVASDGVFIAIGHTPMSSMFLNQIEMDNEGYIKVLPGTTQTSIPGIFAAGDVQDKIFRQAVTAAGQGCMAALEAERFLSHN